jgi:fluoroquinolone resistance protein
MDQAQPWGDDDVVEGRTFEDLDLSGRTIRGREFHKVTFRRARLADTRWESCSLEACVFEACDLAQFRPVQTALHGVRFVECKLMGSDWGALSRNPDVSFEGCDLRYAMFARLNLRKARILSCQVRDASFSDVDLVESDFSGTDLGGTTFDRCELNKANLSTSRGAHLDPARNRVKGARIPVESAVLLAMAAGMRVAGYDESPEPGPRKRSKA